MNARTLIFNLLLFACPCWLLAQEQGADFTASQRRACSPAIVEFSSTASEAVAWQWDFGNGNTSALPNPGTTYQQAGTYDVRLTLTYADGRQEHLLKEAFITILAAPQAAFSASSVQVCAEEELLFEDESLPGSGALIQWIWDFGDGIVDSSGASLPHTYLAGGSFPVTLIVKDENGCSDLLLKEDYLQVQPLPDAGFDVDNNLSCTLPLRVQFTSANQGGSHLWDFGDLSSSNQPNPAHTYTQGGSFSVTHTITDSMGCRQSMVRTNLITANQNQIPLQLSDTVACPGQVLSGFCGAGNFTGIRWRFGNGFESQECEPLFSYSQPGTYQVELSLSGADGCSYTASRSVRVSSPPEVSFTVDDSLLCAPPFTVHFSGQSNQDVSWHWQFGDAGTATGPSPVFTFPFSDTPESYDIGLLVTNADGCSKALGKPELIRTFQTVPRIGFSLREGCAPLEVAFQDSTQTPFEITSWHWDFGDGSTSSLQAPTHTYTDTGYYDVSLAISTEAGCNDTLRWPGLIKAGRPPVADFTIDTNHVCAEMPISFTNLSQYADSAFWQFGDGDTAMSFHPRHVYGDVGWMSVNLTVFNKGCADTLLVEDMIYIDPPVAMFEPGQCYSCKSPATFQFTDLSLGAHRWLWRFGDGDSSTERHPEHTYEAPGFYQISLRVENDSTGCAYEAFGTALVDPPEIRASTNVSGGCAPLEVQFSDHSPEAIKWIWDFGDGDSATTPNASHIYTQPGRYEASLTIVTILDIVGGDTITCTAEQLHYIEVFDPQVDFSVSDQSGCVPFTPQFFDQSVSRAPIASYNWNFGNLGTSNEPNPTFTFTNPGAYSISLAITDTTGCVSATTKFDYVLTSSARPDFVADFPVNCPLNPIQFENRSQGNELSYFWDFGDGATSTLANPTHAYQSPDFYTVELSVSDGICDTSMLLDRYIHIEEPLISLGADLTQADCPPLAVNFTGEILSVHGFNQWVWDLGDGSSSVQRNPSNIYAYAGNYDIGLIATAPSGCADTLSLPNYIQIGGPSASFYFEPGAACPGEPVVFVASGTNVQQYKWDLGDGAILTGPDLSQLTHTYEQAGSYQPVLAIRDADACEVLIPSPDSVRVFPAPRAEFGADTLRFCQEGEVVFTDLSTSESPIASWRWEFGDGSISEEQHPTHFYSSPGNMDVQLTVTTVDGCTSQLMRSAWVEVLADVPPEMPGIQYASVLSDAEVELAFLSFANSRGDFGRYELERSRNGQPFELLWSGSELTQTRFVDTGLDTRRDLLCYRLRVVNFCGQASPPSVVHCPIQLQATGLQDAVALSWTPYQGWPAVRAYRLYRVSAYNSRDAVLIAELDGSQTFFQDTEVFCEMPYTYRVEAWGDEQLQRAWSNIATAAALHEGPAQAPGFLRVSVAGNEVIALDLAPLPQDGSLSYWVLEKEGPGGFAELSRGQVGPSAVALEDHAVQVQRQAYTYRLYGLDSCEFASGYSDISRSVLLEARRERGAVLLSWSPYEGWEQGVAQYVIEVYDEQQQQFVELALVPGRQLNYVDESTVLVQQTYCYRITALEAGGNEQLSYSNHACVKPDALLFTPNAFSPNQDGYNDVFLVKGIFIEDFHLSIFNRWGQLIFESFSIEDGWDGTYQGKNVPEGVFVFQVEATTFGGDRIRRAGTVNLIR